MSSVKVVIQLCSPPSFVPYVSALLLKKQLTSLELTFGPTTSITVSGRATITGAHAVARHLCRLAAAGSTPSTSPQLYGSSSLEKAEVDHWLEYSLISLTKQGLADNKDVMSYLDGVLAPRVYLMGYELSLADLAVFGAMRGLDEDFDAYINLRRWYDHIGSRGEVQQACNKMMEAEADAKSSAASCTAPAQAGMSGKFVDLPGAEMGKVVTRFPPEASGYLHIGHAKAALLNQYYQISWKGKLIMRFDDTNPEKENIDFEKVILEDVAMLNVKPDIFSFTSDYFDLYLSHADKMVADGKAYVDDTPPEQMKRMREGRVKSEGWHNSVQKNQDLWEEMKQGTERGLKCCLRARIDMQSDNGCLRDPTIYRCKVDTPHPHSGFKYKVYPTYDFACPIVDSLEGVTHTLRTTEYHDRDPQYSWFCSTLGIREPHIYEYSRLNLQNTVLSKRKLRWFVEQGIVSGWDDPRFPTVRGVLRHGMTVEGLKHFIVSQGSSRAIVMMSWDKIWACNRKVIDPIAPRYTALKKEGVVSLMLPGVTEKSEMKPKHPKNPDIGLKEVWYSSHVLLEGEDAQTLCEGDKVTLVNWGNVHISKIRKDALGHVTCLEGALALDDSDYKNTAKLTWLAKLDSVAMTPTVIVHFDHLITKDVLKPDEDFKDFVNRDSMVSFEMLGDPLLRDLKKGDIVQIQRRGFYICDEPYRPQSDHTGVESPCILFSIPDGHNKPMPTSGTKKKKAEGPTEPQQPAKKHKGSTDTVVASDGSMAAPKATPTAAAESGSVTTKSGGAASLKDEITAQGLKVRDLKSSGADRKVIDDEVKILLQLKAQYKEVTGEDLVGGKSDGRSSKTKGKAAAEGKAGAGDKKKKEKGKQVTVEAGEGGSNQGGVGAESAQDGGQGETRAKKTGTRLGIEVKKEENLSGWYSQVITRSEMVEYYDVSGCYILRPWAYGIWQRIQAFFDAAICKLGVENCYFPMFVSRAALEKEKEHIADFAPEVAWVTRSGQSELEEPIAIRPTSETVMYPTFSKWVQSHRDLPIKINQWCNIVRWEFKHPQPFLRTREFLWQEGHTAHANKEDAYEEVLTILKLYQRVYEELLSIPVVAGRKTEKEKFAGGDYTTTVEAFVSASGRGIQGATSHHLGQNFAKMFDISYEDPSMEEGSGHHLYAYQNSWGLTTRTIGVMVMVHGDDRGLILPPRVAQVQVIVVPCGLSVSMSKEARSDLIGHCQKLVDLMNEADLRCRGDFRDNYSPGWKFNHWELKGVPLRLELGPRDIEGQKFVCVCRDNGEKKDIQMSEGVQRVRQELDDIQRRMLQKATDDLEKHVLVTEEWEELVSALDRKMIIMAPFCGEIGCEDLVKKDSARKDIVLEAGAPAMGAKALCIPFKQPKTLATGQRCIHPKCSRDAKYYTLFGRSY